MRAIRACKSLGYTSIAVYSEADANAMHTLMADEAVCIGPAKSCDSYRNIRSILSAAFATNAEAIYPGYGFLSENADFAKAVVDHGLVFIGPSASHINMMGNKIQAKETMRNLGLTTIQGTSSVKSFEHASAEAHAIGFPVIIKASAGGGGKGMRIAHTVNDFRDAYYSAIQEAVALFGDGEVYIEKYLDNPRHVEFQILADKHGNVLHLGERECSIQRRNQKLWEEAPSIVLSTDARHRWGSLVANAIREMKYEGAGTIEFLYDNGDLYFMEMNTRIQVEHTVTEMVTGIDLVRWQIRIAFGDVLDIKQEAVTVKGHAIECRVNLEDPVTFRPSPGFIENILLPSGPYVRVDTALYSGYTVPGHYDSLGAKIIVYGEDRHTALLNLRQSLKESTVLGCKTLIPLFSALLDQPDVIKGNLSIKWLDENLKSISEQIQKNSGTNFEDYQ